MKRLTQNETLVLDIIRSQISIAPSDIESVSPISDKETRIAIEVLMAKNKIKLNDKFQFIICEKTNANY